MEKIQNGYGTMTDSYGSKYEGEIVNGIPHGKGTMTSPEGVKQEGNFKNGLLNYRDNFIVISGSYKYLYKTGINF